MTDGPKISADSSSRLVLVVDDDGCSQDYFSEVLAELGVGTIHSVRDGNAALRTLAALPRPPDLLVCDVFMPDMDGIEFLNSLAREGYRGAVILVSGEDLTMMDIAHQVAVENGLKMLGAYTKPVPMAVLADVLVRVAAI